MQPWEYLTKLANCQPWVFSFSWQVSYNSITWRNLYISTFYRIMSIFFVFRSNIIDFASYRTFQSAYDVIWKSGVVSEQMADELHSSSVMSIDIIFTFTTSCQIWLNSACLMYINTLSIHDVKVQRNKILLTIILYLYFLKLIYCKKGLKHQPKIYCHT